MKAEVEFGRPYSSLAQCDEIVTLRIAIHSAIDPITNQRQVKVFTDDGSGNGVEIFTLTLDP